MTQLLTNTHGVSVVYGYGHDLGSIVLHDEDGQEVDLYSHCLDTLREEIIEDYQNYNMLDWASLTVAAQDDRLQAMEEHVAYAVQADRPFAWEEAQFMAMDGLIRFTDLTDSVQAKVDAEAKVLWLAEVGTSRSKVRDRWDD